MSTRKILILGNGFDLAHFLPTKYEHFIHAMKAIENGKSDTEISFNQLFESLIEKEKENLEQKTKEIESSNIEQELKEKEIEELIENYFFLCAKKMYKTDEVKLNTNEVTDLRNKLSTNGWFQYFKDYIDSGIDTWIDFENEIENILNIVCDILLKNSDKNEIIDPEFAKDGLNVVDLSFFDSFNIHKEFYLSIFVKFGVFNPNFIIHDGSGYKQVKKDEYIKRPLNKNSMLRGNQVSQKSIKLIIEDDFLKTYRGKATGLHISNIISYLHKSLIGFINIFSIYIRFIEEVQPKQKLTIPKILNENLETIYSFNYSSTIERLYNQKKSHYLHGKADVNEINKIVLGIADIEHSLLKEEKAYGFVKYYQKLVNNTDYLFLKPKSIVTEIESRKVNGTQDMSFWHPIEIYIWGHSLDSSDRDYIEEIFSFNQGKDTSIRVVIYFYNSPHQQLANLIYILGREVIETWMKNDWLEFIKMPNIYKLNFNEDYSDDISEFSNSIKEPIERKKQKYGLAGKRIY